LAVSFSAQSLYSGALSNSLYFPGGRPALEKGGAFQPTINEKIAVARANADEQFDGSFIEQYKGALQNRLNQLVGQLQQAYNGLLQGTSAAMVKDSLAAGDNRFLWDSAHGNGYVGYQSAFDGLGKQGLPDVDADGKNEIGDQSVPIYAGINGQGGNGTVRFRTFSQYGAALDMKQKVAITMRSEESVDPIPVLSPGLSQKVKEYETSVSEGGIMSGINYLLAWRPSQMNYQYIDGYSQNSDAAGFDGYLSQGKRTSGTSGGQFGNGDRGDGSMTNQFNADAIKWQGNGFAEGYLATENNNQIGGTKTNKGNWDVGNNTNGGDDDYRFANTYYARQRTVQIDPTSYNLANFAANNGAANNGILNQQASQLINNHDNGLGYFDEVNGNTFDQKVDTNGDGDTTDAGDDEWMPGSGKIDETFNGNWMGKQIRINSFNGINVDGNANNPMFGNFELGRFQVYQDPDEWRNINEDTNGNGILDFGEDVNGDGQLTQYLNGINIAATETNAKHRMGQERQFVSGANKIYEVDQRPQAQNSLAQYILEVMRKPMYRDIFRMGLFKDVVLNGAANAPAGGVVNGTLRLSYIPTPDWTSAAWVQGKGFRPGIKGEMLVFQDKYTAKGS